jgi:hypothetical protein
VELPDESLAEFQGAVTDDELGLVVDLDGAALDEGGIGDREDLGSAKYKRPDVVAGGRGRLEGGELRREPEEDRCVK